MLESDFCDVTLATVQDVVGAINRNHIADVGRVAAEPGTASCTRRSLGGGSPTLSSALSRGVVAHRRCP